MSGKKKSLQKTASRESMLFVFMFLCGVCVLPIVIYTVGTSIFGAYAGDGFWDFFGMLRGELLAGEPVVWFLVLSPYLIWQTFRLTVFAFRRPRASA
jgi:hypothetical protein